MLKIRMQRTGRINSPSYRIVVIEHARSTKSSNFLEKLGSYNPKTKEKKLDADRIKYWISVGAQPSATIHNMLVSLGILNTKKINVLPKYKEPVKEEASAAPAEVKEGASAEPVVEEAKEEEVAEVEEVVAAPAEEAKEEVAAIKE